MEGKKNGIVILTNVDRLTGRGGEESKRRTGFDIREVAYLHHCLEKDMQWNIKYVSINGGESPMDPESMEENKEDPLVQEMLKDRHTLERIKNTEKIDDIEVGSVQFVFIPGCRGVLMDISKSEEVCKLACKVYENKGWIATISHGSAGLLSLKRDREYLIKGIRVTGFTDEEEKQKHSDHDVPFSLEQKLKECGAKFEKKEPFQPFVLCDQRIISAQNPQSAKEWIKMIIQCAKQQ